MLNVCGGLVFIGNMPLQADKELARLLELSVRAGLSFMGLSTTGHAGGNVVGRADCCRVSVMVAAAQLADCLGNRFRGLGAMSRVVVVGDRQERASLAERRDDRVLVGGGQGSIPLLRRS